MSKPVPFAVLGHSSLWVPLLCDSDKFHGRQGLLDLRASQIMGPIWVGASWLVSPKETGEQELALEICTK